MRSTPKANEIGKSPSEGKVEAHVSEGGELQQSLGKKKKDHDRDFAGIASADGNLTEKRWAVGKKTGALL